MGRRWSFRLFLQGICVGIGTCGVGCGTPTSSSECVLVSNLPTATTGKEIGIGLTTLGGASVAQPFYSTGGTAVTAFAQLSKVGTFSVNTATLTATIEGTSGGGPDNSPIATSSAIDVSTISSTASFIKFTFQSSVALTSGQTYWLRIKASYAVNSTNYIQWSSLQSTTNIYKDPSDNKLNVQYETSQGATSFSASQIGTDRFAPFKIGC